MYSDEYGSEHDRAAQSCKPIEELLDIETDAAHF